MRITKVKPFLVSSISMGDWVVVKIETDEGISGFGDATIEQNHRTIGAAVEVLERYLVGENPFRIEHLWQRMYRSPYWRGGPILNTAISGIEHALWDIVGKALKQPVYNLLGGPCREKIRLYSYAAGSDSETMAENARRVVKKEGYTAVKTNPFIPPIRNTTVDGKAKQMMEGYRLDDAVKKAVKNVEAIRNAVGDRVDIMLDCHGRSSMSALPTAYLVLLCKELEPLRPLWIEEPVRPDCTGSLAAFASKVRIPIAVGERLYTKFQFTAVIDKQMVNVVQPDLSHAGGILECKKIAAMAEAHDILVAPHCPFFYSPIATAVAYQFDACTPNFLIQENDNVFKRGMIGNEWLIEPFKVENGFRMLPTEPGLGINVKEDLLPKYPYKEPTRMGTGVIAEDGALADT